MNLFRVNDYVSVEGLVSKQGVVEGAYGDGEILVRFMHLTPKETSTLKKIATSCLTPRGSRSRIYAVPVNLLIAGDGDGPKNKSNKRGK
jgi:hypothetical protein